jgi:hypothetical protein
MNLLVLNNNRIYPVNRKLYISFLAKLFKIVKMLEKLLVIHYVKFTSAGGS